MHHTSNHLRREVNQQIQKTQHSHTQKLVNTRANHNQNHQQREVQHTYWHTLTTTRNCAAPCHAQKTRRLGMQQQNH